MKPGLALLLALVALATPALGEIALVLPDPAERTAEGYEPMASYSMPLAPWKATGFPLRVLEGQVSQTAWRLTGNTESTLQILRPLRSQLQQAGYSVVFECETDACGGFDFRYAMEILPEPEMHVDLGDFRFLVARSGQGDTQDYLALLVSRSAGAGFVHLTQVTQVEVQPGTVPVQGEASPRPVEDRPPAGTQTAPAETADLAGLADLLQGAGSAALDDLAFETGSAALSPGEYGSLVALAAYLAANPTHRVTLVGHTDAVGGLDSNIALSRRRAQAVRARLIEAHGVAAAQVGAEGAGWLAPRASNLSEEGRARNRRVEVVLTST
jgi:OOP family OmpA-OmpF porin